MAGASKSFPAQAWTGSRPQLVPKERVTPYAGRLAMGSQVALTYVLIEAGLWTSPGVANTLWVLSVALCILLFIRLGPFTPEDMGIAVPPAAGSGWIVGGGIILAAGIPLLSAVLGANLGPAHRLPFPQACLYAIWALVQQFVLQSFFFVRMESLLSGKSAVIVTAFLFAGAHIPNFVLAFASFAGGLFFCEMFRRYRNIFPLGAVHAGLGWMVAANFSDSVMHHMRVGMGYIRFHP
jgi:hypothetical protein